MKKFAIITLLLALVSLSNLRAQTVIEMTHPGDANLVLLQVDQPEKADIVIYMTDEKMEAEEWDCMWKFRKWGFSNFSVYLTSNPNDTLLVDNEMGLTYGFHGKVFFTSDKNLRGYKTPGFQLEGVFRKTSTNNTDESKKSKEKARQEAEDEYGDGE